MTIWRPSGCRALVVFVEPHVAARVCGSPAGLVEFAAQPQPAEDAAGVTEADGSPRSLREQQPVDPGAFSHFQLAEVGQVGSKLQPAGTSFARLAGQLAGIVWPSFAKQSDCFVARVHRAVAIVVLSDFEQQPAEPTARLHRADAFLINVGG